MPIAISNGAGIFFSPKLFQLHFDLLLLFWWFQS